jgi:NADP-dependent aldehyde dehydrogenase
MVYADGPTVGVELVTHPAIAAVAFTGSRRVGLALVAAAAARPVPIPVFAEMSAVNPVFLLPGRLSEAPAELGAAFVGSLTLGAGQFCTNPGIVIGIDGPDLDSFTAAARAAVAASPAAPMLTGRIAAAYADGATRLADHPGTEVIALGEDPGRANGRTSWGCAALVTTTADEFLAARELHDEVFGATSVIVWAADPRQLVDVARAMEGQLTATVHAATPDAPLAVDLLPVLERLAGRILFNGWPTGVEVVPSMVHGGPFPATSDSRTTSVGTLAMDRFLRPVAYQDVPDYLLPEAVRESNPDGLLRMVDGAYTRD